ncbi:MAG TPA: hypothetical protein DC047_11565 [Blastocatellia bacterium]|nr:hypothetical protein [Blastocatellia bacterium]
MRLALGSSVLTRAVLWLSIFLEFLLMTALLGIVLIIAFLFWLKGLTTAIRQRMLTKSLLRLLKRADVISQDKRSEGEGPVAAASLKLLEIAWPRSWLRRNVEAARTVLAPLDGVINQFSSDDKAVLAHLLDSEQRLLAKRKVAFGDRPCERHGGKIIVQVLYYERHGHGHFGIARVWCRHCLVSWEQQWEIAVSGGH